MNGYMHESDMGFCFWGSWVVAPVLYRGRFFLAAAVFACHHSLLITALNTYYNGVISQSLNYASLDYTRLGTSCCFQLHSLRVVSNYT